MMKTRAAVFSFLLVLGYVFPVQAQEADSIAVEVDSLAQKQGLFSWFSEGYPAPSKALILSAIPGGGQAYNKRWWKMPIVYGALGGMVYLIDRNTNEYLYYKRAYRRKVRGLPHDLTGQGGLDSPTVLKSYRDKADKNVQLSYIGFVAVYSLAGIEAFVDAHLASFDVSDDLSLDIRQKDFGVSLTVRF